MSVHEQAWPDGTPAWVDIAVPDLAVAQGFYGPLLGWEFDVGGAEAMYYTSALRGGRVAAGLGPLPEGIPDTPTTWRTYLATTDAAATAARADAAGAQTIVAPMPVVEFGTMSVLVDPTGTSFGLWQAGSRIGAEVVNEPGTVIWLDHLSGDPAAAQRFYGALFAYTFSDMSSPEMAYTTLELDGRPVAGFTTTDEAPSWAVTFAVSDTDAAVADVLRLGGTLVSAAHDSPFGRQAGVAGPFGERFWLISTEEPSSPPRG